MSVTPAAIEAFIARWQSAGGSERANYQLFITELCELLGLPKPEPAVASAEDNAYVFERRVTFRHGDELAANFTGKGRWKSRLPDIIKALEALGRARRLDDGRWLG